MALRYFRGALRFRYFKSDAGSAADAGSEIAMSLRWRWLPRQLRRIRRRTHWLPQGCFEAPDAAEHFAILPLHFDCASDFDIGRSPARAVEAGALMSSTLAFWLIAFRAASQLPNFTSAYLPYMERPRSRVAPTDFFDRSARDYGAFPHMRASRY